MYEKYRKLLKPSTTGNGGGTISRMHPHPPPPSITSTDGSMNPTTSTTGNTQLTAVSPITSVSAVSPPQFSFGAALQVTSTVDGSYTTVFRVTVIVENTSNAPMQDVFVTCVPVHKEFVEIVKPVTKVL